MPTTIDGSDAKKIPRYPGTSTYSPPSSSHAASPVSSPPSSPTGPHRSPFRSRTASIDDTYSDHTGNSTLRGPHAANDPHRTSLGTKLLNKLHLRSKHDAQAAHPAPSAADDGEGNVESQDYERFLKAAAVREAFRDARESVSRGKLKSASSTPKRHPSSPDKRGRDDDNDNDARTGSPATRHFPGDLYSDDGRRASPERKFGLPRSASHRSHRADGHKHGHPHSHSHDEDNGDRTSVSGSEGSCDAVYDTDISESARPSHEPDTEELAERALATMPFLEGRYSFESDHSDDSMDLMLDDATHYDLIRRAAAEQGHSLNDVTLRELAVQQRNRMGDLLSEHDSASGGANQALRKPLIELEEVELENFLNSFARHTREVKVPDAEARRAKRMPQWSDFRIRPDDGQVLQASGSKKRTKLLARVDRGLQTLKGDIEGNGAGGSGAHEAPVGHAVQASDKLVSTPSDDCRLLPSRERSSMTLASGQATPQSLQTGDDEEYLGSSSKPKRKKRKLPGRSLRIGSRPASDAEAGHDGRNGRSGGHNGGGDDDDDNDEDWNLIVPSASRDGLEEKASSASEVRVNARDEQVDGIAFCIAYILALVEKIAPEELDYSVDRGYREGVIRSHVERLYTIAPFWEQLGFKVRRLYRWEDPKTTATAAMVYFVLWYSDMIPSAFMLSLIYGVLRFKYFPPSESYLHDKVRQRMARGRAANKLSEKLRRQSRLDILNIYKRWAQTYGAPSQEALGLLADWHEKVKNLILWRNPKASQRSVALLSLITVFVTFAPAHYVFKSLLFLVGITFFCLLPLQSYFPTHRKALSPVWWILFGAPTDAQFAVQLLRKRHLELDDAGKWATASDVRKANKGTKSAVRPDKREAGVPLDQIPAAARGENDYVETTSTTALKPRKLGSFFCQYKGLPGRLHINTRYLYFTPLHNGTQKRAHTPLSAVGGLTKTKNIRLWLWSSLGMKVARTNGKPPILFANIQNRDEAFNLILAVCSNKA
ncbi:uncharacterized protein PSFLO_05810 [Pseudozyma flocculosa]|nr:uncharacterized protein PSFLO_05810 [Pseudozyma flocculosa]